MVKVLSKKKKDYGKSYKRYILTFLGRKGAKLVYDFVF